MDELESSWSTPVGALVACAIGGVALGIAAVAVPNDRPGQVLVGVAAFGLLTIAALGFAQRPKLAILTDGRLQVKRVRRVEIFTADDIARTRVVRYPRLGRRVPILEIELRDERLLLFGRWDLGVVPDSTYDALVARGLA